MSSWFHYKSRFRSYLSHIHYKSCSFSSNSNPFISSFMFLYKTDSILFKISIPLLQSITNVHTWKITQKQRNVDQLLTLINNWLFVNFDQSQLNPFSSQKILNPQFLILILIFNLWSILIFASLILVHDCFKIPSQWTKVIIEMSIQRLSMLYTIIKLESLYTNHDITMVMLPKANSG